MNWALYCAAGLEIFTGAALIAAPSLTARLLLGIDLTTPGETVGRLAGLALLPLALACWPRGGASEGPTTTLGAMLLLSILVAAYLVYLGVSGAAAGVLLWPAVATHLALAIALARAWTAGRR
jgi:hypothetical protein